MRKTHPHPHTMLFKDLLPTHTLPPTPYARCLQSSTNNATQLDPFQGTRAQGKRYITIYLSAAAAAILARIDTGRAVGARVAAGNEAGAHTTPTRRQEQDVHTVAPAILHTYTHRSIRGCAVATRSRPQLRCTADTTNAGTKRRTEGAATRNSSLRHRPRGAATSTTIPIRHPIHTAKHDQRRGPRLASEGQHKLATATPPPRVRRSHCRRTGHNGTRGTSDSGGHAHTNAMSRPLSRR